jgi:prepilin-type N-terminal cleavage/methylation domain-containing protein
LDTRGVGGLRRAGARDLGLTLIEILIAMAVVVVALLGATSALYFSDATRESTREKVLAQNAARRVIEQMRDADFTTLLANYSTGGTPGDTFTVERLNPIAGVPVGQIAFPVVGGILREDIVDADWSMPRDLSGDGLVDAAAHNGNYRLLPVRITIRWRSIRGQGQVIVNALITLR